MSSEVIDLITKLVLLAIAVLGLYKTWKFGGVKAAKSDETGQPAKREKSFFMEMVEIYGFMLLPIGFILVFSFLINLNSSIMAGDSEPVEFSAPEIDESSSELEVLLAAAVRVKNTHTRGVQLTEVVTRALEQGDYRVAILAASSIPNQHTSDTQLKRVMEAVAMEKGEDAGAETATEVPAQ